MPRPAVQLPLRSPLRSREAFAFPSDKPLVLGVVGLCAVSVVCVCVCVCAWCVVRWVLVLCVWCVRVPVY